MTDRAVTPLPALIDSVGLQRELGVSRTAAEKIMRALPVVELTPAGLRKSYVRREDVLLLLQKHTMREDRLERIRG